MKLRLGELLVPTVFAGFGLVYFTSVQGLPRESTVFPYALLICLTLLIVLVLSREAGGGAASSDGLDDSRSPHLHWRDDFGKPLVILLGSLAYLALFRYLGFLVAGYLFMSTIMLVLRVRALLALFFPLLFVAGMYLLFSKLFYVDL